MDILLIKNSRFRMLFKKRQALCSQSSSAELFNMKLHKAESTRMIGQENVGTGLLDSWHVHMSRDTRFPTM